MNNMNDKSFDLVMPAAQKLILENDIDINIKYLRYRYIFIYQLRKVQP